MASRNVQTFRRAHQAFVNRDFDAVVRVMTEDVTYRDPAQNATFRGRDGFRDFMQGWVTAFSGAEPAEPTYLDAGDTVIAEFTARGVNDGPFGPLAATGKRIEVPMCEIMTFNENGQIVSGRIYYDKLLMLTQLGHTQASAAGAAG